MEARCKKPEKVQREIRLKSVQKPEAPPIPPSPGSSFSARDKATTHASDDMTALVQQGPEWPVAT